MRPVEEDMKTVIVERAFADGSRGLLGRAHMKPGGWRFYPNVSGRQSSTKAWPTWQECLPRWVGYPNKCETRECRE